MLETCLLRPVSYIEGSAEVQILEPTCAKLRAYKSKPWLNGEALWEYPCGQTPVKQTS